MRGFIQKHPLFVLQAGWVIAVLWCEVGIFYHSASSCTWPDYKLNTASSPAHILVVADPQLLDHDSYPGRTPWLMTLTQFIVDTYLRKAWRVAIAKEPDAIVFLGDMLDNGRVEHTDDEYSAYISKFKSIFATSPGLPVFYLPGNHDVWLGDEDKAAELARLRFQTHFGPLSQHTVIGNHSLVFVDAPQLVEDDKTRIRETTGGSAVNWMPSAIRELKKSVDASITNTKQPLPLILFSHIPLSRPDGTSCGPLREKGVLRAGRGFGYENTLSETTSRMLLSTFQPSLVFSGDDHDYCEVTHTLALPNGRGAVSAEPQEISVKSLSMAMGIQHPGFQLLSLASPQTDSSPSFAHEPCSLPNQIGIYVYAYVPFFLLTSLVLFALAISGQRRGKWSGIEMPVKLRGDKESGRSNHWQVLSPSKTSYRHRTRRCTIELPKTVLGRFTVYLGVIAWPALLVFALTIDWLL